MARNTPAGARTGDTPPTPDNGNDDVNVDHSAETAPEIDTAKDFRPADQTPDAGEGGTVAPGTDPANVEKITVRTTGDHMFSDPYTREQVDAGETKSIIRSTFVENAIASGQLEEA